MVETRNSVQISFCGLVFLLLYPLLLRNGALIAQYYRGEILGNVVFLQAAEIHDKFHHMYDNDKLHCVWIMIDFLFIEGIVRMDC